MRKYFPSVAAIGLLTAAVILAAGAARLLPVHAAPIATPTPMPTATPAPTATAIVPQPGKLLAQANGAVAARGSVFELGALTSSNQAVTPGFHFSAGVSWRLDRFRDDHRFSRPQYVRSFGGYVRDIRRVSSKTRFAEAFNGSWMCPKGARTAADLWQPPSFSFTAPRLVGQTTIRGLQAWDISGVWTHAYKRQTTRLTVDVFIEVKNSLYLQSKDSGVISVPGGRKSRVTSTVSYYRYDGSVPFHLPAQCSRKTKKRY